MDGTAQVYITKRCYECYGYLQEGIEDELSEIRIINVNGVCTWDLQERRFTEGDENQILNPSGISNQYLEDTREGIE